MYMETMRTMRMKRIAVCVVWALLAPAVKVPAQATGAARAAAAAPKAAYYYDPAALNLVVLVPAPPAVDSAANKAELTELHRIEQARTPEQVAAAKRGASISRRMPEPRAAAESGGRARVWGAGAGTGPLARTGGPRSRPSRTQRPSRPGANPSRPPAGGWGGKPDEVDLSSLISCSHGTPTTFDRAPPPVNTGLDGPCEGGHKFMY